MTVTRVTLGHDGTDSFEEMPSVSDRITSDDFQIPGGGVTYRAEGALGSQTTADLSTIPDDAVVSVDGVEMTVSVARHMGLMGSLDGPTQESATSHTEQPQHYQAQGELAQNEVVTSNLEVAVQAGELSHQEALEYDLAWSNLAQAGMTLDEGLEIAYRAASGEFDIEGVSPENRQMAADMYNRVMTTATQAAQKELSDDELGWLGRAMEIDPHARAAVEQYVVDRATGQKTVSWPEAVAQLRAQIGS
ncbi:MAG: hypothetical protein AAFY35_04220 [Pseudomonadota bacterium]